MITLPEHVQQAEEQEVGFRWDGTSIFQGQSVPNKETAMDWTEHQRIVCNARQLLMSWTADQHTGKGKQAFRALKDAYDGSNNHRSVLRVSKGIHQPEANPHLQVRVVETFGGAQEGHAAHYTFHLDVGATEVVEQGLVDRFRWDGVQFSYLDEERNLRYWWPGLAVPRAVKNSTLTRRNSISFASLANHRTALAEQEKQRVRLEQQAQAQLQAKSLEEKITLDLVRLKTDEGMELRKLKGEPPANFYKGKAKTFVVNKYGKNGYYVIWDEKTQQLIKTY